MYLCLKKLGFVNLLFVKIVKGEKIESLLGNVI